MYYLVIKWRFLHKGQILRSTPNAAKDENLNETLERVFRHIEESAKGSEAESDFAGLFDDYDVNSNKLGSTVAKRNEKLVKLLNGVGEMNLGEFHCCYYPI